MARPRAWVDRLIDVTLTGPNLVVDLLASATVNLDTITVTRLIIDLYSHPTTLTSNVSGIQKVEMGIGVVTGAAFDAGQASVPDPRIAADAPARGWLWRGLLFNSYQNVDGTEKENYNTLGHVSADLGAMRKVDRGKLILILSKTAVQGSEVNQAIVGLVRVLCLT